MKIATYVIARNARNRPTVMHELPDTQASLTSCGIEVSGWSRCFIPAHIATTVMKPMMCGSCNRSRLARSAA